MIQWCTASDVDARFNLGLQGTLGSLDGLTLIISINSIPKTLGITATVNATDQTTFLATLNTFFTGATFTVDYFGHLVITEGVLPLVMGNGTANSILGLTNLTPDTQTSTNALNSQMFGSIPADSVWTNACITECIGDANSLVSTRLRSRYALPPSITNVPYDLKQVATYIAAYNLQIWRGFSPNTAQDIDNVYTKRYEWALEELKRYSEDEIHPELTLTDKAIPYFIVEQTGTMLGTAGLSSLTTSSNRGYN